MAEEACSAWCSDCNCRECRKSKHDTTLWGEWYYEDLDTPTPSHNNSTPSQSQSQSPSS